MLTKILTAILNFLWGVISGDTEATTSGRADDHTRSWLRKRLRG